VVLWLLATCLLAATPVAYFVSGGSDDATESSRVVFAAIPVILAWFPLSASFGLIQRKRTGRWALGAAGRRAVVLVLIAAMMLAVTRSIGAAGTIQGDGPWTLYWLSCLSAWTLVWRTCARRTASR
jgi:hypothetical protein